ncbi:MAG: hypothetical protein GY954_05155 [Alteromonas sp.]|nr:hypothetical protein [Alteromonas sp.]
MNEQQNSEPVDALVMCRWCGKKKKRLSEWEQQRVTDDTYLQLCIPCANKRLNNPMNALLPMRKIGT